MHYSCIFAAFIFKSSYSNINPTLISWLSNNVDGILYLPTRWTPVLTNEPFCMFGKANGSGSYQVDFYEGTREYNSGTIYPFDECSLSKASFEGSLLRSTEKMSNTNIDLTTLSPEICFDSKVEVLANENKTMCYWTMGNWKFYYIGMSFETNEDIRKTLDLLISEWSDSQIIETMVGEVEIILGNKITAYYTWEKNGYYWSIILPYDDFGEALDIIESFQRIGTPENFV